LELVSKEFHNGKFCVFDEFGSLKAQTYSSPGNQSAFHERFEPNPVGQPLVITEGRDAERAESGTPGNGFSQRLALEQSGKDSCAERVSGADRINFRNRAARAKTVFCTIGVPSAFVASLQNDLRWSE
jgi:hypothetical protein